MIRRKNFFALIILFFCSLLFSVDTSGMSEIYKDKGIIVFAEDSMDYSAFISNTKKSIKELEKIFKKNLKGTVSIYIYANHKSSSQKIFGSEENTIQTAMADPVNLKIYLTSPYDTYKTKDYYYTVPIHELVHLFYSPSDLWLREGIAVYLSGQLDTKISTVLIDKYIDLYPEKMSNSNFEEYYQNFGWVTKYLLEDKLGNSIQKFIVFCRANKKEEIIGYKNMDKFIDDWNLWIKKKS